MSAPPLRCHDVRYRLDGEVAVVTMDNPPVNGLGCELRCGLVEAFEVARRDPHARAIVLCGSGPGFSAGGDIREFGTPAANAAPALSLHVHPVIEDSEKPVVAAIHGFAIGGGLETALACHYRVAAGDAKVGVPELKLGVIPLSGTQRLPRVLGLARTIDLVLGAELLTARRFDGGSLFDKVIEGDADAVLSAAIAFARERIAVRPLPLIRHRPLPDADPVAIIAMARARLAPDDIVAREGLNAIVAAAEAVDFDVGMAKARAIYDRLIASEAVRKQRDRFFAARAQDATETRA